MPETNEIESLALNKFSFLQNEFAFCSPILRRDAYITTISYLSKEIGIEIEIDWREFDVFILITKLDKGKLPKGYYVSNGNICRVHLEEVLQNSLNVSKGEIEETLRPEKKRTQKRMQQDIITKITRYQQLLQNHTDTICNARDNLFKKVS